MTPSWFTRHGDRAMGPFVDLRPGEGFTTLASSLVFFLVTTSYYLIKPVRNSLFLGRVGADKFGYPGFRLGFMPGNLPRLMGVLLLDRFALGPSVWSDLAGFAYHFWNGAAFGTIFLAVTGGRSVALAILYGIAIGVGFLVSPVVQSLGVGLFGRDFGGPFAATVLTAHVAFGATLGVHLGRLAKIRGAVSRRSPWGRIAGAARRGRASGIRRSFIRATTDIDTGDRIATCRSSR